MDTKQPMALSSHPYCLTCACRLRTPLQPRDATPYLPWPFSKYHWSEESSPRSRAWWQDPLFRKGKTIFWSLMSHISLMILKQHKWYENSLRLCRVLIQVRRNPHRPSSFRCCKGPWSTLSCGWLTQRRWNDPFKWHLLDSFFYKYHVEQSRVRLHIASDLRYYHDIQVG